MFRKEVVIKKHLATRVHLHVFIRTCAGMAAQRLLLDVDISHVQVCVSGCVDRSILLELRTPAYCDYGRC